MNHLCGLLLAGCLALAAATAAEVRERPDLVTPQTETAVQRAQAFLVRSQGRDGSWRASEHARYPITVSSLAGLALMAGGSTPTTGPHAESVSRAVEFVLRNTGSSGLITTAMEARQSMYGHGFAMLFLAEAYGMETNPLRQQRLGQVLRRAVRLTAAAQSRAGGWYYTPESPSDEGSVTVTQIQGLRACRNAGIKVPPSTIARACEYIHKCANSDGGISYSLQSRGNSLPAITAAATATMYNGGEFEHPVAIGALGYIRNLLEKNRDNVAQAFRGHAFYSMLYVSQAMWFSGNDDWRNYYVPIRDHLISTQAADGSWNGDHVGTVYGTSIALLVLQLPWQYLPILQR